MQPSPPDAVRRSTVQESNTPGQAGPARGRPVVPPDPHLSDVAPRGRVVIIPGAPVRRSPTVGDSATRARDVASGKASDVGGMRRAAEPVGASPPAEISTVPSQRGGGERPKFEGAVSERRRLEGPKHTSGGTPIDPPGESFREIKPVKPPSPHESAAQPDAAAAPVHITLADPTRLTAQPHSKPGSEKPHDTQHARGTVQDAGRGTARQGDAGTELRAETHVPLLRPETHVPSPQVKARTQSAPPSQTVTSTRSSPKAPPPGENAVPPYPRELRERRSDLTPNPKTMVAASPLIRRISASQSPSPPDAESAPASSAQPRVVVVSQVVTAGATSFAYWERRHLTQLRFRVLR